MKRSEIKKKTTRRCGLKSCKKEFTPKNNGQVVCSFECSLKYTAQNKEEAEYKANKEWKDRQKEGYEKLKTHSDWSHEIDEICQEIARLLDNGCDCTSCQKPPKKKNGGHRFSKQAEPALRHNLLNIFLQCEACNSPKYRNGNPDGYDKGLELYFGKDVKEEIHALRLLYKTNKQSIADLIQAKSKAKKVLARLKKADLTYTNKQRIELRKQINSEIGIYL